MTKKIVPETIKEKILALKRLETTLGHLPKDNLSVSELQKRVDDSEYQQSLAQLSAQTEILFTEICDELLGQKFDYLEIANTINAILSQSHGLKYCNEVEVREALGVD